MKRKIINSDSEIRLASLRELQSATGEGLRRRSPSGVDAVRAATVGRGVQGRTMMSRKRKKKGVSPILKDLANKVTAEGKIEKFLFNPKGEISMSDAISQLIKPYRDDAPDYNSFNNLVTFACIAWNTSLLPEIQRTEALDKMLEVIPGTREDRLNAFALLTELMERKRKLFPNVSRMIMEHKVTDQGNNFHIAIASTLEKKGVQK